MALVAAAGVSRFAGEHTRGCDLRAGWYLNPWLPCSAVQRREALCKSCSRSEPQQLVRQLSPVQSTT